MINRREFLQYAAAAGSAGSVRPIIAMDSRRQTPAGYFTVHPFIENHPEAVFIMKTDVGVKTDDAAKRDAGLTFGRSVFVPDSENGIPVNITIPMKPNMKTADPGRYDWDLIMSHVTDPFFCEGMMEGMKELGIGGGQFRLREVNLPEYFGPEPYGFAPMCERVGADIRLDQDPEVWSMSEGEDFHWVDVPDGVFYNRIPYLAPINEPDTFMLNISKFKAHGMGLTLCCKNLQGSVAHNYQQFCAGWNASMDMLPTHRRLFAYDDIRESWERHRDGGVPRWDKPGQDFNSGLGMETWATRTLDNLSVTPCGLHIIEGIYGRDGQGNNDYGPNPVDQPHNINPYGTSSTGKAWDWMSNIIIFGKDPFRVDIIGHWLGGHEPGNMGLFHCALDRGMSTALDPHAIPLYTWDSEGGATLTPLSSFERTPLLTYYLCRNYEGQNEPVYHLCDEPFDYGTVAGVSQPDAREIPESIVLHQNSPNPFNPLTSIEFTIGERTPVRMEVYNGSGQLVDVIADGFYPAGTHMVTWNSQRRASGTYFYRLRAGGFETTRKMLLLK